VRAAERAEPESWYSIPDVPAIEVESRCVGADRGDRPVRDDRGTTIAGESGYPGPASPSVRTIVSNADPTSTAIRIRRGVTTDGRPGRRGPLRRIVAARWTDDRCLLLSAIAATCLAGAAMAAAAEAEGVGAAASGPTMLLQATVDGLRASPPILFFTAFLVASLLPFPIALFYVTSGAAYGIPASLAWIAGALVVSNLLLHAASRSLLHPAFQALAARRGHRIPVFDSPLDEALFIGLVRITPGIPYFLQNVILAAARLDLLRFVVLSVAIQMIYATGFVVLGRSALEGRLAWALAALVFVVVLAVGARWMTKRRAIARRGQADDSAPGSGSSDPARDEDEAGLGRSDLN
jgi:uncharacterized membrane protein YdjX (TVP38/TMEM64 family)